MNVPAVGYTCVPQWSQAYARRFVTRWKRRITRQCRQTVLTPSGAYRVVHSQCRQADSSPMGGKTSAPGAACSCASLVHAVATLLTAGLLGGWYTVHAHL